MKIEVLYLANCPTHPDAMKLVSDVLSARGMVAEIREILVADEEMARELGFRGSPTIRIDGQDIVREFDGTEVTALCCRLYPNSSRRGVPPSDAIDRAIREAHGDQV
jgi:hypothetical protein